MSTTFPQCDISLEFLEILSRNPTRDHSQSVSGNSEKMLCRILINMPYSRFVGEEAIFNLNGERGAKIIALTTDPQLPQPGYVSNSFDFLRLEFFVINQI